MRRGQESYDQLTITFQTASICQENPNKFYLDATNLQHIGSFTLWRRDS